MAKGGIEFRDKVIENLRAQLDQANSGIQMMGRIMHNNTVAMQAAWIEWVHGDGAESAMQWIENTLDGPDLIPDEDEPHSRDSQAYFDANKTEPK